MERDTFPLLQLTTDVLKKVHVRWHTSHAIQARRSLAGKAHVMAGGSENQGDAGFGEVAARGACTARLHLQAGTI